MNLRVTFLSPAVLAALGAALLFGASTPLAKQFVGEMSAFMLAGLLYLGSGMGLLLVRLWRDRGWRASGVSQGQWPWLMGAIAFGGVAGPALLMLGLAHATAAAASLLLNLEGVLTALLAWLIFKENADRRIVIGMLLIVAGGVLLAWPGAGPQAAGSVMGPLYIAAACFCWAVDNNLTRKVSNADAFFIAGLKGWAAAAVNIGLALTLGSALPDWPVMAPILLIGFSGYGLSLVLFVIALRGLGAARTGAYFGAAPFIGSALAIAVFGEPTSAMFWSAALLMALGIALHLSERHEHLHTHRPLRHGHPHVHDEHHQHLHQNAAPVGTAQPHDHVHDHEALVHRHTHFPDIHHRHDHATRA